MCQHSNSRSLCVCVFWCFGRSDQSCTFIVQLCYLDSAAVLVCVVSGEYININLAPYYVSSLLNC